jgi:hypothetical protein
LEMAREEPIYQNTLDGWMSKGGEVVICAIGLLCKSTFHLR